MDPICFTPAQVAENFTETVCVKKAKAPFWFLVVLGILAGAFIGFGGMISTLAGVGTADALGLGLSKILSGSVFSVGLMLVVIGGAELFTGNNLIMLSALNKTVPWSGLLRNWVIVFIANFIGGLLVAWLYWQTKLWVATPEIEAAAIKIATTKVGLEFWPALVRGILCNWLVCMAVWLAAASKEVIGKVLGIFFPIMTFVALGFEHSIANMYFIPLGIFLGAEITWTQFFVANLLPVTIGNIIGGAFFVGFMYWVAYVRKAKKAA